MFKIKPLFCILTIILLSSCATTKVWVDKDQIKENESVAFIGFDIKNVLTGQYSNSIDNQVSDGLSIFFLENNLVN